MHSGSVESLVEQLEMTMKNTDKRLEFLSMKLDMFESRVINGNDIADEDKHTDAGASQGAKSVESSVGSADVSLADEGTSSKETAALEDDDGIDPKLVRELLFEVTRVRCEYDQLHNEIRQVQELQQEVTRSVRKQMKQVQSHFDDLRNKIIGSGGGGKSVTK